MPEGGPGRGPGVAQLTEGQGWDGEGSVRNGACVPHLSKCLEAFGCTQSKIRPLEGDDVWPSWPCLIWLLPTSSTCPLTTSPTPPSSHLASLPSVSRKFRALSCLKVLHLLLLPPSARSLFPSLFRLLLLLGSPRRGCLLREGFPDLPA